jgi:hypothetical protein
MINHIMTSKNMFLSNVEVGKQVEIYFMRS